MMAALVCGAVVFPGVYFGLRKRFRQTFTHWTDADVACVSERLMSALHASLSSAAGLTVALSCKDVMIDNHWLVNNFVLFGAPYMAFDIYAMYLCHFYNERVRGGSGSPRGHSLQTARTFLSKDWLLVLHHVALLLVFIPITLFFRRGLGDFFVGCFLTTEFSTPFISIGKILIQLRLDDSMLHRINGLMVLLTFFVCRILLFPFMYWKYSRQLGVPLSAVAFHMPLHCNLGNLLILTPQVYWFLLLLRKANRLYQRGRRAQDKDNLRTD